MTSHQTFQSDGVGNKICEPSTSNADTQNTNEVLNHSNVSKELQILDLQLEEKERVIQDLKLKIASFELASTVRYKEEINFLNVELMKKEKEISLLSTGLVLSTHVIWKVHSELSAARLDRNNLVAKLLEERVKIANLRIALAKKDIDAEKLVERTQQTDGVKILNTGIEKLEEETESSSSQQIGTKVEVHSGHPPVRRLVPLVENDPMQQNVACDVHGEKPPMDVQLHPKTNSSPHGLIYCLDCGGRILNPKLPGVIPKEASGGKVPKSAEKAQKKK